MKKKAYLIGVLVAVLVVGIFVGITFLTNRTQSGVFSGAEKVYISLDEFIGWKPLLDANGGLITTADSINAKNGINIEYVIMNDATASSNALISGNLSGAGYTINRYTFLQSKFDEAGVEVVLVYITNYSNGGDGIISISDIKSVNDLVGKKIAVPRYSEAQTLVEYLIRNSSLTEDEQKSIKKDIIYFETADETAKAFFSGQVDAAATWEPYLTQAASSTSSRILFDTSMSTNLILDGLVFKKEFVDTHQDFIVKLIDGALEAASMYTKNFDYIKKMPMFELMTSEEIVEMCMGASLATWADNVNLFASTTKDIYKEMAEIWISVGETAKPDKAETAFSNEFIGKLAGKYPTDDVTSFAFSEEGRNAASQIDNNAALLSVRINVEFEVDSYKISRSSYPALNEFAETAKILNGVYIQIEGNTAHVEGDDGVNFSYMRALSVAKYLQVLGINSERFIVIGNGDKNPIATNETEEGKAANRRTDVYFKVVGY